MTIGIEIKPTIGIGDALQFSSVFENFFRATGKKLLDINKPWFLDYNPFALRDDSVIPNKKVQLWNFSPNQFEWPEPARSEDRPKVYLSNAEIWATVLGVKVVLNRPRLYRFEDFPFASRKMICLHVNGVSHGEMPEHIIRHVIQKYAPTRELVLVGNSSFDSVLDKRFGLPQIPTKTLWDFAELVSKARIFIGIDSGPSWIASCYPDVIVKKVRTKPIPEVFESWVPLQIRNIHSHWDSRECMIHNPTENDIGFTWSYKRL